jgi:hypothetical protein
VRWRLPYALIAAAAIVAWGAILLVPDSLFWDDRVLSGGDVLAMTRELGIPWLGPVFVGIYAVGPWLPKVIVLVSTIVIGWLAYRIAGAGLGLREGERLLIGILVVVTPVFLPRMVGALSTYSWSLALFMIAWALLVRPEDARWRRAGTVLAALLLFASYTTGSLLPFTALPVLHVLVREYRAGAPLWRELLRQAGRYWYVAAAPLVFWVIRTLFLQPYGLYAGYNDIGTGTGAVRQAIVAAAGVVVVAVALLAIQRSPRARESRALPVAGFLVMAAVAGGLAVSTVRSEPRFSFPSWVVVVVLGAAAVAFLMAGIRAMRRTDRRTEDLRLLTIAAVGAGMIGLAVLPYLLVGKVPLFEAWDSRHQLLLPFGIAVLLTAAMGVLPRPGGLVPRIAAGAVVAAFALTSLGSTLGLIADWHKQQQLTELLAQEDAVAASGTVVFVDEARDLNYDGRELSFYEYTFWMADAFGDHTRLGLDPASLKSLLGGELTAFVDAGARYGFGDWTPSDGGANVTISELPGATWWGLLVGEPSIRLDSTTLDSTTVDDLSALTPAP